MICALWISNIQHDGEYWTRGTTECVARRFVQFYPSAFKKQGSSHIEVNQAIVLCEESHSPLFCVKSIL